MSDFGLAKRTDREDDLTFGSGALGTPHFMPPEQTGRGLGEVGPHSDVYGLGSTLYYLLTGRPPFVGEAHEVIAKVRTEPPDRPRSLRADIPPALEGIVLKCLEKNPADRYPSAAALAADLDRFLAGQAVAAPRLTRGRRARRWAVRNRGGLLAAGGGLAVGTGLLLAGWLLAPVPERPEPRPGVAEQPRPDPIRELQRLVASGPVDLLDGSRFDETGKPRGSNWRLSPSSLGPSPTPDRAPMFQTESMTLLELLPDPGIDKYRLSVELRQMHWPTGNPPAVTESVGVYFGHDTRVGTDGRAAHTLFAATFADRPVVAPVPLPQAAAFGCRLLTEWADVLPGVHTPALPKVRFTPVSGPPGAWRRVVIDVSPGEVRFRWRDDKTGQMVAVRPLAADGPQAEYARLQPLADQAKAGITVTRWHPRMPLGVWCRTTAVAVKTFVIEPIP